MPNWLQEPVLILDMQSKMYKNIDAKEERYMRPNGQDKASFLYNLYTL